MRLTPLVSLHEGELLGGLDVLLGFDEPSFRSSKELRDISFGYCAFWFSAAPFGFESVFLIWSDSDEINSRLFEHHQRFVCWP